ncbi:MAG TPA: hypothetical protein VJ867_11860 [Gemmatimonadaceae bacterium]|nr:hypothetical protein [Gemmatimonadaceae bacterium]
MTATIREACAAAGALLLVCSAAPLAQMPMPGAEPLRSLSRGDVTTESPTEHTLLLLALADGADASTTIRPFDAKTRARLFAAVDTAATRMLMWTPVAGSVWFNSTRPRFDRDGAVWQGRGMTAAVAGGLEAHYSVLHVALRPIAFATQNRPYTPLSDRPLTANDFRQPFTFTGPYIDLPYRFGPNTLARLDPGESFVTAEAGPLSAGFSTASQHWGPANFYPLVMGVEAPGYPRAFVQVTALPLGIGRGSLNWSLGRLESSGFAQLAPGRRSRALPAVVATFQPAGLPGVEIGGTRVMQQRWTSESASMETALEPFGAIFKNSVRANAPETNQLASVFVRIAPPRAGIEVYGELLRDDHNVTVVDLFGEPDHESAYVVGLRRAWRNAQGAVRAVTVETANGRISHLQRVRPQASMYIHTAITEGHTNRGQLLGSSAVFGGGGTTVSYESVQESRSFGVEGSVRRSVQNWEGGTWNGRVSGFAELRVRTTRIVRDRPLGWSVGLDHGFGFERGTNLTLQQTFDRLF